MFYIQLQAMSNNKLNIYISWYNDNHKDQITTDDVWITNNGQIKDFNNGEYEVLSQDDIEKIRKKCADDYADELKSEIDWILKQSNIDSYSKYVKIDKDLIYDEYNQFDTKMLTNCKNWLAQDYEYEGDYYDIVQV